MKIRGKLRRERCRRPRGKNRTGIGERPHDPTSSALQWRRRLRCVRPRSKAAGDVRCTKSIMRVTMATAQPPTDAAPQHQFMIWKGPSLSIGRASFKRPSGLIEHERNSGSRSRFEPGRFERGEHHIITLREFAFARQYFPQIKGESISCDMSRSSYMDNNGTSFIWLDGTASGLLRDTSIRSTGGDTIGDKVA